MQLLKLLVTGALSWAIVGAGIFPVLLALGHGSSRVNSLEQLRIDLATWQLTATFHLLIGVVWSVAVACLILLPNRYFLLARSLPYLRALGAVLGGLGGLLLAPQDAGGGFQPVELLAFVLEGIVLGSWLAASIAVRAVEGARIVGVRLPNAVKALAVLVAAGVVSWLISGTAGLLVLLGYRYQVAHMPTELLQSALVARVGLAGLTGITHGLLSFLAISRQISPRQSYGVPPSAAVMKGYVAVAGIATGGFVWASFGIGGGGHTALFSSPLQGAFVGAVVCLAAGGGATFGVDVMRRTYLWPSL